MASVLPPPPSPQIRHQKPQTKQPLRPETEEQPFSTTDHSTPEDIRQGTIQRRLSLITTSRTNPSPSRPRSASETSAQPSRRTYLPPPSPIRPV
ncbi:hypothetical protein BC829DRAFT_387327, partial [Chytridium lagenaria]